MPFNEELDKIADELANEARSLKACIDNGLYCRRHHPSYGFTKKDIWRDYHQLCGLLFALELVNTGERSADRLDQAKSGGAKFGISLQALRIQIEKG